MFNKHLIECVIYFIDDEHIDIPVSNNIKMKLKIHDIIEGEIDIYLDYEVEKFKELISKLHYIDLKLIKHNIFRNKIIGNCRIKSEKLKIDNDKCIIIVPYEFYVIGE